MCRTVTDKHIAVTKTNRREKLQKKKQKGTINNECIREMKRELVRKEQPTR